MALQLWLPLDGTLENKGCADAIITNNGATIDTVGKIGSCYSFDGSDDYISVYCQKLYSVFTGGSQPFSVALWVYLNDSTRNILFNDYITNVYTTNFVSFQIWSDLSYRLYFGDSSSKDWFDKASGVYTPLEEWTHLVCTYDGSSLKLYKNGICEITKNVTLPTVNKTQGDYWIGYDTRSTTALNGKLNDLRIYDHCLSAAEVKEISQGLILHYKLDNIENDLKIIDSSGYGHHGKCYTNTITTSLDTARYSSSIYKPSDTGINCGRGGKVTDSITINIWAKWPNWPSNNRIISCTESGGWYLGSNNTNNISLYLNMETTGYKRATAIIQPSTNMWHMITGVYDRINQLISIYIDGELSKSTETGDSNPIYYNISNVIWLGAEANSSKTNFASANYIGNLSDFRIYCTPLSSIDIKELYQTSAKIDKTSKVHTFEFIEDEDIKITKTGIIKNSQITEFALLKKLKYDLKTYIESDGSAWVRIFHHNNPASKLFSSTDDFENSVYIDEDRWFNFEICNNLTIWEIMIKTKKTSTDTEKKFRWIQSVNPLMAVYADVSSANITKIVNEEYLNSSLGGIYKKNANTYIAANDGSSSHWLGAIGSWTLANGKLPGYCEVTGYKNYITNGYEDVYIRIDNQYIQNSFIAKMKKAKSIIANDFIEK